MDNDSGLRVSNPVLLGRLGIKIRRASNGSLERGPREKLRTLSPRQIYFLILYFLVKPGNAFEDFGQRLYNRVASNLAAKLLRNSEACLSFLLSSGVQLRCSITKRDTKVGRLRQSTVLMSNPSPSKAR